MRRQLVGAEGIETVCFERWFDAVELRQPLRQPLEQRLSIGEVAIHRALQTSASAAMSRLVTLSSATSIAERW